MSERQGTRVRKTLTQATISSDVCRVQSFFTSQSLHNGKKIKKKSGDVNDEVKFPFFFLLHKRAKPILPPYLLPHLRARTQTLYSSLTFSLTRRPPIRPFLRPLRGPRQRGKAAPAPRTARVCWSTPGRVSAARRAGVREPTLLFGLRTLTHPQPTLNYNKYHILL
jgi:hypothetical protein